MLKKLIIILSISLLILIAGCSNHSYREVQGEGSYNHSTNTIKDSPVNVSVVKNITRINTSNQINKTNIIHVTLPKCVAGCGKGYDYNKTDCKRYCYELDDYCFCNKTGLRGK